jgi:DDE family transposase/uncharacterized protein DUF4372
MPKNTNLSGQPVICQLLSFIPTELIERCVYDHQSDYYYKTMSTFRQLVFLLYGVTSRCHSLRNLCKGLLFLKDKLCYLGIDQLPATSTLSDANINRSSDVFGSIYHSLYNHYSQYLSDHHINMFIGGEVDPGKVEVFDSSTVSLFVDIFKGAGRNPVNGKKKGGLKVQAKMPLSGFVPDFIELTQAAYNDKNFLGQLNPVPGTIYVFDKGYVSYKMWKQWTDQGVFYVTRLNDNAQYQVITGKPNHISEYANGGIISDQIIHLSSNETSLDARLIVYKDPVSGNVLKFISNMFDYQDTTVIQLYKYRWGIEVLFKQIKQNFELGYFYSDSSEGIKTQVWIALIANLIFTVIHRQVKECELFVTIVSMASNNLGSYTCLITLLKRKHPSGEQRDIKIVQLNMFNSRKGGGFENTENDP